MSLCLWLIPLGVLVGALGTLIGAGGGFLLVPVLLLMYPQESPELVTSVSLAVVFLNAFSGSVAYARMRRIDYRSALLFGPATIPGAVAGAIAVAYVPRRFFNGIFGVVLVALCVFLLIWPNRRDGSAAPRGRGRAKRTIVDANGTSYVFSFNPMLGLGLSIVVGFVSSILGIGGGIIHVPALVHLMNFPAHVATATSHLMLAMMACAGSAVHAATGELARGAGAVMCLGIGALVGAQAGARISSLIRGVWIIRALAVALGCTGIRVFTMAF